MIQYQGKWALITGASAGIGECFARELAKKKTNLILVARRADRLETLATELKNQYAIQVEIIPIDLCELNAAQQVFNTVEKLHHHVDILINNAGMGVYGPLHQ